jgi:hypothetical protein
MWVEQTAFVAVTLALGIWITRYPGRAWAKFAVTVLALVVWYFGPPVFGRSWYYEGFVAGLIFGDFAAGTFEFYPTKQKKPEQAVLDATAKPDERPESGDRNITDGEKSEQQLNSSMLEISQIVSVCEELRGILDLGEFKPPERGEVSDLELTILPPHHQERIRESLKEEKPGLRLIALSSAIQQTYIEAYEMVQQRARQYLREYCERRLQETSRRFVETNWLKEYIKNLIGRNFIAPDHPGATEIMQYSDREPPTRLYSFLLRLFSEREWFPRTAYASPSPKFFAEAELLRNLATAVGASISEAVEPEAPYPVFAQAIILYVRAFGMHVNFRIKAGFVSGKYTRIFDVLGGDLSSFMAWVAQLGTDEQNQIRELFGRVLRFHCWQRFPSGWKTLRELVHDFERWDMRGPIRPVVDQLLGEDKSRLLSRWVDRAKEVAKPDGSPQSMEELLQELEASSARPVQLEGLLESLAKVAGPTASEWLFDPFADGQSIFHYYPTILFQERMEDALRGNWDRWEGIERRWKLRAIKRGCQSFL